MLLGRHGQLSASRIAGLIALLFGVVALLGTLAFVRPWRSGPSAMPNVSLMASTGKAITQADLVGQPHLMFFGFTNCPDVCPTTLTQLSQVFEQLGADAGRVRGYFVTVDPERDTADVLASYLASFNPRLIGLTGSRADIDAMIRKFRVVARQIPTGGSYVYDHSTAVYMVDAAGQRVGVLNLDRPTEAVLAEIKALDARR